jgi:hypothetical protein
MKKSTNPQTDVIVQGLVSSFAAWVLVLFSFVGSLPRVIVISSTARISSVFSGSILVSVPTTTFSRPYRFPVTTGNTP